MHKSLSQRLLTGAVNLGVIGTSIVSLSLRAPLAQAVEAESVTLGTTEVRLDTGSTAGAFNNPYLGGNLATDSHGHTYAAFTDTRDTGTSVYVNRSSDYGGSYQAADVRVDGASGAGTASAGASVCTDGAGAVYVMFPDTREGAAKLFMAVSRDYGATFAPAARVGSAAQSFVVSGGGLTCDHKGNVYVAFSDERSVGGTTDLYFQRSSDYGSTWQAADTQIDSGAGTFDTDNASMASDGSGRIVIAYDDNRNGTRDIFVRTSSDYGATWGSETIIDGGIGGTDVNPSIGTDLHGHFVVAWQTGALAPIDLRAASSADGGATWSSPVIVNPATNIDVGAAVGEVVVDPSGVVLVTYTDVRSLAGMRNAYVNRSTDFGVSFAAADSRLDLGRAEGSATMDPLGNVSIDSDRFGNVVATFSDDRTAVGDYNVFINASENLGSTWQATDTRISSGSVAGTVANDARIALDDRARANVMYSSDRTTPGTRDVYARMLTFTLVDEDMARLGGADRYATSALTSASQYPARSVDCMVIASGQNFPDALAGAPLAARCQGPLLLTKKDSLPATISAEITRAFDSVDDVETDLYVLGGDAAVAPAVKTALAALDADIDVKVLSGATRIETALATAAELDTLRGSGPSKAWVTRSDAFPDALVLGAAAGSRSVDTGLEPVLLTPTGNLDSAVAAYLASKTGTLKEVFVAGGTSAVSAKVLTDIDTVVDTVTRFGGKNRYETGKIISTAFFGGARTPLEIIVASGTAFPDPLSGGPNAAAYDRPIVLSQASTLPTESASYVTSVAATVAGGAVLGGTAAIADSVKSYVQSLY